MTPKRWQEIEDILDQVMPRPPEERTAQLDRLCGEDATLRGQVEEMLIYCDQAQEEAFLEKSPLEDAPNLVLGSILTDEPETGLQAGDSVDSYRIVEHLKAGGMGEVYLAERTDPHMRVALKVVKRGMDTDEILRRFRYEREILARLEHPNIARLHDAGVTDDGRPYFAMEYVEEGRPLDAYCDAHNLSVRARLELFTTVCEAVRYAHRNLVVHRDLKPGNILVNRDEAGQPQVKLLDFGIAKLLEEDAALHTIQMTEAGARRMTPNYAAPEQITGEATTTATDVYALGVILYKLLTGRRPYHFEDRSVMGIERVIRHTMPDRPSTVVVRAARINGNGSADPTPEHLSRQRAASPKGLRRQLKGDLDAIVLMALRKEAERRYASAGEFLDDIQRYLDNRPVVAQHDSVAYRASKFVQRHTAGVTITVAVVVLITTLVSIFTARLADEVDRANQAAARAISTRNFMLGTFELANPDAYVDPSAALDETYTKRDLIETNLSRIDELSDPLDQAVVMEEMAKAYLSYGEFDRADSLYSRTLMLKTDALGEEHPDVAASLNGLAVVAYNRFEHDRADSLYRRALEVLKEAPLEKRRLLPEVQNYLAFVLIRQQRAEEAKQWFEKALAAGDELERAYPEDKEIQLDKAVSLRGLATVLRQQGELEDAERRYREALEVLNEAVPTHPHVAHVMYSLAGVLKDQGDFEGAEQYYLKAKDIYHQAYGDESYPVGTSWYALALLYHVHLQDYHKAEMFYDRAAANYKVSVPPGNLFTAYPFVNKGVLFLQRGDTARAEEPLREALTIYERSNLPEHGIVEVKILLGDCLRALGRYGEAEQYLLPTYRALQDQGGAQIRAQKIRILEPLVRLYEAWQKPDRAAPTRAMLDSLQASAEVSEE